MIGLEYNGTLNVTPTVTPKSCSVTPLPTTSIN